MGKIFGAVSAMKIFAVLLFSLGMLAPLRARVDLLLVPPAGPVVAGPGLELTLYVDNPTNEAAAELRLPPVIEAVYASETLRGVVKFEVLPKGAEGVVVKLAKMTSQTVTLRLMEELPHTTGFVTLRLTNPASNTIMFKRAAGAPPPVVEPAPVYAAVPLDERDQVKNQSQDLDLRNDVESVRRHISGYEPIYFVVGARGRINARFQFSFKYRVLEQRPEQEILRDFYFAYTQTSIWDLESSSKPFYDSSYKPTVFFQREKLSTEGMWRRVGLQVGAQHESNGKGGGTATRADTSGLTAPPNPVKHPFDTRSLNSLYVAPRVRWSSPETGWFAEASARAILYLQMDENPDLPDYRGHVEVMVRGGHDRGGQLSMHLRGNPRRGRGSVEFNATWPVTEGALLKRILPGNLLQAVGGYWQIQYFNGYGESLLDYDVRRKDQLRFGLQIVR